LDHHVGAQQQGLGRRKAEQFRRLEVGIRPMRIEATALASGLGESSAIGSVQILYLPGFRLGATVEQ
jgi:hypothetical protein